MAVLERWLVVIAAFTVSGACSIDGDFEDSEFLCAENPRCPTGFLCSAGVCLECPNGECPEQPTCGTLGAVQNDFDDGEFDLDVWSGFATGDASGAELGGRLRLEVDGRDLLGGVVYGTLEDSSPSGSAAVEVVMSDLGPESTFYMQLANSDGMGPRAQIAQGVSALSVSIDDVIVEEMEWSRQRYWLRFTARDGRVAAEWSESGLGFEELAEFPFDAPRVLLRLGLVSSGSDDRVASVELDNLGLPPGITRVTCD